MVENHYDFINVHHHKSNAEIEKLFKELAFDDSHHIEVNGECVYLPSPNFHAVFLLRHAMNHFASSDITMRQLLDWAFFMKNHSDEIDWPWFKGVLENFGMKDMYNIFNAICVEDLGFDAGIFRGVQFNSHIKDRVLKELFSPAFSTKEPKCLLPRLVFKIRRWKASQWKHELCYMDSMWSAFLSGVWSHLLKPSSI